MALTNFGLLTQEQLTVWSRDTWKYARNYSFINQFMGTGPNSMIQRVTELKKDQKGARAVITLVADLEGDGIAGDRTLEGNEEAMKSFDQVITLDQLRHANKHEGKMADQRSVVTFRENSRDVLAYWLADRMDQMAFLHLSGVSYANTNRGTTRTGSDLVNLAFAADASSKPPTSARYTRWKASGGLVTSGATNTDVVAADTITWDTLVNLKAYAKDQYIRGMKGENGMEAYHVFLPPLVMAKLKLDNNYLQAVRNAAPRDSKSNPLFSGAVPMIDGLYIHEFRHVYNTLGAASGSRWGAGGAVHGARILMCGSQALAMADIGDAEWNEKGFDYDNQQGISYGKIFGLMKPQFQSQYSGNTVQDFGVLACDLAI